MLYSKVQLQLNLLCYDLSYFSIRVTGDMCMYYYYLIKL